MYLSSQYVMLLPHTARGFRQGSIDYRLPQDPTSDRRDGAVIAALGALEISFIVFVGGMTVAAGLFGLYVLLQLFRNSGLRRRGEI